MKHILKTTVILLALIGSVTNNTIAAGVSLPQSIIMKKDKLISRHLARVGRIEVQVSASSILWSSTTKTSSTAEYTPSSGQSDEGEVLDLIKSQNLQFEMATPEIDNVYLWSFVYDKDWSTLFYGVASFKLEPDGSGGWRVPQGANHTKLMPVGEYHTVQNLRSTYFAEEKNGWIEYHSINVWESGPNQGGFQFPSNLMDKKGTLFLRLWDPTSGEYDTFAYDSETGLQIKPTTVTVNATGEFLGVQKVTPMKKVISPKSVVSVGGFGESDVVQVTITEAGTYRVYHSTTEDELPDNVEITYVGDKDGVKVNRQQADTCIEFIINDVGIYHLLFEWPNLRPPNQGGGGNG